MSLILEAFKKTQNEQEYQDALKGIARTALEEKKRIDKVLPQIHAEVDVLARSGIVENGFMEHALVDAQMHDPRRITVENARQALKILRTRRVIYRVK